MHNMFLVTFMDENGDQVEGDSEALCKTWGDARGVVSEYLRKLIMPKDGKTVDVFKYKVVESENGKKWDVRIFETPRKRFPTVGVVNITKVEPFAGKCKYKEAMKFMDDAISGKLPKMSADKNETLGVPEISLEELREFNI